jgi:hypothetical protein
VSKRALLVVSPKSAKMGTCVPCCPPYPCPNTLKGDSEAIKVRRLFRRICVSYPIDVPSAFQCSDRWKFFCQNTLRNKPWESPNLSSDVLALVTCWLLFLFEICTHLGSSVLRGKGTGVNAAECGSLCSAGQAPCVCVFHVD